MIVSNIKKGMNTSPALKAYNEVCRWIDANKMMISVNKCNQMFISLRDVPYIRDFSIPDVTIVEELRFLGVIFDSRFKWHSHVLKVSKRAASRIFIIKQLKPLLDKHDLVLIYNNCIRSILEYAAPLFAGLNSSNAAILENVQNYCHRIICGTSRCSCSHFVPLFYRRVIIGLKLFDSLVNNADHPLHHLRPRVLQHSGMFCMPACNSVIQSTFFMVTMIRLSNSGFPH